MDRTGHPSSTFADFEAAANNRRYNLLKKFNDLKDNPGQTSLNNNNNDMLFDSPSLSSFGRRSASPFFDSFQSRPSVKTSFIDPYMMSDDDDYDDEAQFPSAQASFSSGTEIPITISTSKPQDLKDTRDASSTSASFSPQMTTSNGRMPSSPEPKVHHIPIVVEGRGTPSPRPSSSSTPSSSRSSSRVFVPGPEPDFRRPSPNFYSMNQGRGSPDINFVNSNNNIHPSLFNPESEGIRKAGGSASKSRQGMPEMRETSSPGPFVTRIPVTVDNNIRGKRKEDRSSQERPVTPATKVAKTPIDLVNEVNDELAKLRDQVESFSGKQGDKEYRFLDEMLTRLLIKLDNIDSQGLEEVRKARKSSIISVQQTVSLLESKVRKNSVINNVLEKEEEEGLSHPRQEEEGGDEQTQDKTEQEEIQGQTLPKQELLHEEKNEQQEDEEMKEADSIPSQETTPPPETEMSQQQEPDDGESKEGAGHKMIVSAQSIDADEDGAAVIEDVMDTDGQQS